MFRSNECLVKRLSGNCYLLRVRVGKNSISMSGRGEVLRLSLVGENYISLWRWRGASLDDTRKGVVILEEGVRVLYVIQRML